MTPSALDLQPFRWSHAAQGCQSNDWAVFQRELQAVAAARGFQIEELGRTEGEPILLLTRPAREAAAPHRLVASGFHGEEPAGPWGLLQALQQLDTARLDAVHLSLLPLVNVSGFVRGRRFNHLEQNPNRGYRPDLDGLRPSEEGAVLLAHGPRLLAAGCDGLLTCHEDVTEAACYLYANEDGEAPGPLACTLCATLGAHLPLQPDGVVDGATVRDGIVFNQTDSSFESWMKAGGAARTYCSETPGQQDFAARVAANAAVVAAFVGWEG